MGSNIDIKIIYDTREKDLKFLDTIEIDKRRRKDGTKIIEIEQKTVKPRGVAKSTGDITYEYRIEDGKWIKSNLAIEIKKSLDIFQSTYLKASYDRLIREVTRAKEGGLDFYFICDSDITLIVNKIKKLENIKSNRVPYNAHITFINKFLKLNKDMAKLGFVEGVLVSSDLGLLIRRLVKNNITKELKNKC